jgi:hypothetical protein
MLFVADNVDVYEMDDDYVVLKVEEEQIVVVVLDLMVVVNMMLKLIWVQKDYLEIHLHHLNQDLFHHHFLLLVDLLYHRMMMNILQLIIYLWMMVKYGIVLMIVDLNFSIVFFDSLYYDINFHRKQLKVAVHLLDYIDQREFYNVMMKENLNIIWFIL